MTHVVNKGKLLDAAHPVILSRVITLMTIGDHLQVERGRSPLIDHLPLLLRGQDIWIGLLQNRTIPVETVLVEIIIIADHVVLLLLSMTEEDRHLLQQMLLMQIEKNERRKLKRNT